MWTQSSISSRIPTIPPKLSSWPTRCCSYKPKLSTLNGYAKLSAACPPLPILLCKLHQIPTETPNQVHKGNLLFGGDYAKLSAASAAPPSTLPPFYPLEGEAPGTFYPLEAEAAADLTIGEPEA